MAKNPETETNEDVVLNTMPGSDPKTEEEVKPFEVDLNGSIFRRAALMNSQFDSSKLRPKIAIFR